ncbi:MAG TPA: aspartate aminotransferase family protein [Bacteroidales bacterium]|jgi:acetylornithine/succinyldiaminopimelate/putrescine aminotransferase|nr:aspartate aminotransferase family protein [Bacteroidales bacterium]MBP7873827.1 aspartate aminotransferase family protein [Bacteroidales bacterium]MCZ2283449.1 aspartate aminotransferase family protein [Bacteroidales bacterium]HPX34962.1 aspartate aminotransferase family protein [Bacteroidales bacterium]HQF01227.1 aspartate aminotransferase family protein [Bacteroidales bacterium]
MLTNRQIFFQHLALPSQMPLGLEVERAEGIYMYSPEGKRYIDLVSGVCVNNLGHRHPAIVRAVKDQLDNYMHLMVYGEMIQTPQVKLAQRLTDLLPRNLNSVYLVNSGSEAIEGALKLAKRFTGRTEIIGFKNSYHGGTHGALTMLGNEEMKYAYRPLLPDVRFLQFNSKEDLFQITERTACVLVEPVQAEAGVIMPKDDFLMTLRQRCSETGTLLIFDEIQTGFGRTGKLFCFMDYNVTPDILCIAKAMGGGMPIGAFIADKRIMLTLTHNPDFGHITTFGGHPVSAAAAIATLEELTKNPNLINQVDEKGAIYESALKNHSLVKGIRRKGLLISIELPTVEINQKIIQELLQNGLVTDPFFFMPQAFRIAPPLIITKDEIALTLELINKTFKNL